MNQASPVLSVPQRCEITAAVEECHLELRWAVGDHPDLPRQLESLARRMFLAGMASQRPINLTLQELDENQAH